MSNDVHSVELRRTFDTVGDTVGVVLPMLAVRSGDVYTRKVDGPVIVRLSEELRRAQVALSECQAAIGLPPYVDRNAVAAMNDLRLKQAAAWKRWRDAVDTRL